MKIHSIETASLRLEENKRSSLEEIHLKKTNTKEALKGASEDFEAFFLQKLLETMNSEIGKNDILFSEEERLWKSMLHEEYAKSFSKAGGIGIAKIIYNQLESKIPSVKK